MYAVICRPAFGRDEQDFQMTVECKYPFHPPLLLLYIYSSYAKADSRQPGLHIEGYYVFRELFLPVAHANSPAHSTLQRKYDLMQMQIANT